MAVAALVCAGLGTRMGLSRFLGDWAGIKSGWLRLKPAKTEITGEMQKVAGGGDNQQDKHISALPTSAAAFYTQIKFAAQRSC